MSVSFAGVIMANSANAAIIGQLGVLDSSTGLQPGDQYRLIFLTSTTTNALSSDITTYNSFVQATAAASTTYPGRGGGPWNIMGSTLAVDARDNTGTNPDVEAGIPIFLTDGLTLLASNNSELWSAPSAVPVTLDENGVEVSNTGTRVFTGSFNDGTGVGAGGGGGANGDGTGSGDTSLGVLDGQGVQTGQPVNPNVGLELQFWIREWKEPAANSLPVYALSQPLTVIPEPSSIAFLGMALTGFFLRRRK